MAGSDLHRVKRIGRYLGRDRRRLALTVVLLLPLALAGAIQPLLVGQAIAVMRRFAGNTNESVLPLLQGMELAEALRWIVVVLMLSVLLRFALQRLQLSNNQTIGYRLTERVRQDLFAHAMNLSVRFHDRMPVGKLLTRLTSDVDALSEVFASGAVGVLGDLVSLVVIAATMVLVEWRLGLLLLAAQIPITLAILWLQRRYRKANYRVREELSQLNADFQENLQGLEVVQMFRREAVNGDRFRSTGQAYRRAVNGTIFFDSSISAFIEWVALGAVAVVLAFGGWMVTAGAMGIGTLITFILYSQKLFDPLRQLAERFTQIQGGLTAVERIGELLEEPLEIVDQVPAVKQLASPKAKAGEVVFDNVSFAYRPDEPILRNLSFRIAAGEHVALVGPTGSGKTTVIRLLCRLYEPQQGRILLDGQDIRSLPTQDLRRQLGVVLQDTFLFSGTVADNLRLDVPIKDAELRGICNDLGLAPLLDRLPDGLNTTLRERGGNLSSGERQLLAVTRVAIRNPTVLVMDEATAFMDPSTEATLQRDLDRLLEKRTAVVIAHRLATVEAADRIFVLRRGELIEEGTHLELRARGGLYAELADLQERGLAKL